MPAVLAVCDTCGTPFPSGFFFENATNITMVGNRSGLCPNCGGTGSIPDGRYDVSQDSIRIMATSAKSVQSLQQLASVLRSVNRPGVTGQAVAAAIQSQAPQFSALVPVVQRGGFDVKWWLPFIVGVIAVMIMMWDRLDPVEKGASAEQIREIYQQVLQQTQQVAPTPTMNRVPLTSPKTSPSRNAPCPCGSRKRYRHCHGRAA